MQYHYDDRIHARIDAETWHFRFPLSDSPTGYIDNVRSTQIAVLAAASQLLTTGRGVPKSATLAARIVIPYCAHATRLKDRLILLNRGYKPLGMAGGFVDYDAVTLWQVPKRLLEGLDCYDPRDNGEVWFFSDSTSPLHYSNKPLYRAIEQLIHRIRNAGTYPWIQEERAGEPAGP
jgi:hypothetical protein